MKKNRVIRWPRSIQSHILIYFSILSLVTVLVMGIIFYYKSFKTTEKNAEQYAYEIVDQVGKNVEYYLEYMENVSSILYYNPLLQSYLESAPADWSTKTDDRQKMQDLLDSITKMRNDIVSIFIFGDQGQVLSTAKSYAFIEDVNIQQEDWYRKALDREGQPVVSSSHVQNFLKERHPWVVSLSRGINSFQTKKNIGVFLIDMNYKVITDICSNINLGQKGYVFIVDGEGNIVYHPQQQLIYAGLKSEDIDKIVTTQQKSFINSQDGENRLITIKTLSKANWKVVGVSYPADMWLTKEDIKSSYIMIVLLCFLAATVISAKIASNISQPIKKLELLMEKVEGENFDVEVDIRGNEEIEHFSAAFRMMLERIKELMAQIKRNQKAIRKSELRTLQAQINPHFLYNTLDSIVWMAESKKYDQVVLMTSALAKFFRISLSKGQEVIKVRDEIEHIKYYLVIQKLRYDKKLQYSIDVDGDVLQYDILKLILQPLVENAIYHGIKGLADGGNIEIKGMKAGDKILLQVKDNGKGIDPEKMEKILMVESTNSIKVGGVGIKNVHERIQLYYGDEYGLSFESEPEKGTTVNIWIPAISGDGEVRI